jgi:hypothetical protein
MMSITVSAFAATPPKNAVDTPLLTPPAPKVEAKKKSIEAKRQDPEARQTAAQDKSAKKDAPQPLDAKTIDSMHIDPNLRRVLLGREADTPVEQPQNAGSQLPEGASPERFQAVTDTTIVGASQASNDASEDYEPAIIVNRFGTTDRVTTVFMKYDTGTLNPNLHFRTTTDFVNYTGGALPLPAGHSRSADPILAENYSTSGAFPKRTYCSGVSLQVNGLGQYTNGALNVWHTDNPGTTAWTLTTVDTASSPTILDKPSIWTSWHSGTLGYTYLAAIAASNTTNTIRVYRKTTTNTWTMVNNSISGASVQSPIITVDVNTGDVYLVWMNWSNNTINMARSTDMGSTFGTAVSFNAGPIVNGTGNICDSAGANCLRGTSVLMARPNSADNSIGVVYHRRDTTLSNDTDVYFNSFDYATQTWGTAVRVNDNGTRDQFNPALDPDANGNYMITWYDRRDDVNDRKYLVYGARVDASGNALEANNVIVHSNIRASDPNQFPADSGGRRYMGEYQDIWEWLGTWYAITMYAPDPSNGGSGQPDVYIVRIQP